MQGSLDPLHRTSFAPCLRALSLVWKHEGKLWQPSERPAQRCAVAPSTNTSLREESKEGKGEKRKRFQNMVVRYTFIGTLSAPLVAFLRTLYSTHALMVLSVQRGLQIYFNIFHKHSRGCCWFSLLLPSGVSTRRLLSTRLPRQTSKHNHACLQTLPCCE